jgi:dTDP-glucose pyrophosphorylase/quercetin dioxygenase-like cupin family protein
MDKIVYKPWGKEIWIEQNKHYCYKRIYINKGCRTSYQYHNEKLETNYIISGQAEIWLENDNNVVEKNILNKDDYFTVLPGRKHRVIAISDIILQEVSTPQVDDVIRIEDDTQRESGRIEQEHLKPAFCIVSSGKGTRMHHLTENINKALLPINGKAVISHIIEKIPSDYDIIITTGYKANFLKEYVSAAHQERNITFIDVLEYDTPNSGPGASLLKCEELLQRPFYFSTVDCLIESSLPLIDCDWIGVSPTSIPDIYSTAKIDEYDNVIDFKNKSKDGYDYAFIGLSAIYDYKNFWNTLKNNIADTGEVVSVYMSKDYKYKARKINWYDTGTIDSYMSAKRALEKNYHSLEKTNEYFYDVNNKIIKIFNDDKICSDRIKRSESLEDYIPNLTFKGKNVYAYEKFKGNTLYELDDNTIMIKFLKWIKIFWDPMKIDLKEDAKSFYYDKTIKRIDLFLKKYPEIDNIEHIINGKKTMPLKYYINKIDWELLIEKTIASETFHGDLQFDNVIYSGKEFKLIDWRQSFGNSTQYGDIYYDLAKLYGGLIISYNDIKKNKYAFKEDKNGIELNYKVSTQLEWFRIYYRKWLVDNGFDLNKVELLTAIIYLNMMPLHEHPFDLFLFYQAKLMLSYEYR